MASFVKRSFFALLFLGLIATTSFLVAQEAAEVEPPALEATAPETSEPPTLELTAEQPADETEETSSDSTVSDSSDSDSTVSGTETTDDSTEVATEEPETLAEASESESTAQDAPEADTAEEGTADEADIEEEGYDYGALIARSPDFFAITHPAVIHFPIALWVLGALFVVIGLFVPTWRQQIPITCLLIGTAGAIVASITGWWYADFQGYAEWNEIDWEDTLCRHRWIGVAMSIVSLFISLLALYSAKAESWFGGFLWRTGLILLALAACYEGHIGGELIHSTSIEEAFVEWINPSE